MVCVPNAPKGPSKVTPGVNFGLARVQPAILCRDWRLALFFSFLIPPIPTVHARKMDNEGAQEGAQIVPAANKLRLTGAFYRNLTKEEKDEYNAKKKDEKSAQLAFRTLLAEPWTP